MGDVQPGMVCLRPIELQAMLADAAEQGAKRTLARLGIDDEKAMQDLQEVRDLLSAWRTARRVAWETAVRTGTVALLAALALGLALNWLSLNHSGRPGG